MTSTTLRSVSLFAVGLALTVAYFVLSPQSFHLNLVDATVYARGIDTWMAGGDPYPSATSSSLPFVYPPIFLYIGAALTHLLTPNFGWHLYIAIHLLAAVLIPWLLYRFYLPQSDSEVSPWAVYALFFAAPGFIGLLAAATGNIAVIFYALMLATASIGFCRNRWLPFYLAILACASIKPGFLPFLLLPLLYGRRQVFSAILTGLLTTIGLFSQRLLNPTLYARFTQSVANRTTRDGDVGVSLYGMVYHLLHSRQLPGQVLIATLAYATFLFAASIVLIRLRSHPRTPDWQALVLSGVLLLSPRLEFYDLCVAFPLVFLLFTRAMRPRYAVAVYLALSIPALYLLVHYPNSVINGGLGALAILAFWIIRSYRHLRARSDIPSETLIPLNVGDPSHLGGTLSTNE